MFKFDDSFFSRLYWRVIYYLGSAKLLYLQWKYKGLHDRLIAKIMEARSRGVVPGPVNVATVEAVCAASLLARSARSTVVKSGAKRNRAARLKYLKKQKARRMERRMANTQE